MRQRQPRLYDAGYLRFLRTKACCICGSKERVEAAHIRIGLTGMQRKPDDKWAVPLCSWCHRIGPEAQHKMSEAAFWEKHKKDPFVISGYLYHVEYEGTGGVPKGARLIKPRRPKATRTPFAKGKRPWPKTREGSQWPSRKLSGGGVLSSGRQSSRRKPAK